MSDPNWPAWTLLAIMWVALLLAFSENIWDALIVGFVRGVSLLTSPLRKRRRSDV